MKHLKTRLENPKGLHQRYVIRKIEQVRSAEEIVKNYYNGLHSWQDANPLDLIKLLNASQFQTPAIGISEGSQWVSVETDLLPPMDEKTEIILKDGVRHLGNYDGADSDGKDRWFCDNNDYHYPTHWKLLSPPPAQSSQPQPNTISVIEEEMNELLECESKTEKGSRFYHELTVRMAQTRYILTKLKKQP